MNWKEFLKPDLLKAITVPLLTTLLLLSLPSLWGCVGTCPPRILPDEIAIPFLVLLYPLMFIPFVSIVLAVPLLSIPFLFIYSYLIVSFIVWIYDKIRKK